VRVDCHGGGAAASLAPERPFGYHPVSTVAAFRGAGRV